MFEYIKKIFSSSPIKSHTNTPNTPLDESISKLLVTIKTKFKSSADLTIRQIKIDQTNAAILTMEGMVEKKTLTAAVISPLLKLKFTNETPIEKYNIIKDKVLAGSEQIEVSTYENAWQLLMSGFALLFIDKTPCMLAIGVQGFSFRGIDEPNGETSLIGPREGLVEPIRINMTLIRRRMKTPNLKFEMMNVGQESHTDICLCYLTNVVSDKILQEVRKRICKVDLKNILAPGYLSPYLEEKNDLAIFSSIGITERPDTICGKISQGRIAILIDGTPNALIVPYVFSEYFKAADDYTVRPYFATLNRWLKYIAFLTSILLPGLYVAIETFNPEILPPELITKIAQSVMNTPFPLVIETLITHIIYEIMREAGLRLPKNLGHAISIVGALVIGDAAVNAGIMGASTLMVVAVAAMSSYVIPNLYEPVSFLRVFFIIVGGLFGMWGITLLFCAILINICSKNNFGVPFSAPLSPFRLSSMKDVLIRTGWKTLSQSNETIQSMPGAENSNR